MALPEPDAGRKREVGEGGGRADLLAMQHEAAGLLGLRGDSALYTFPFLFCIFSLAERGACAVERHGTHTHGCFLAHSRLLHLSPLGSAFRGCDGGSCRCYSWGSL
jgi:hypothetical protein